MERCAGIIDAVADHVVAVKPQLAFFSKRDITACAAERVSHARGRCS
jgi:hypothetical protein